MDNKKRMNILVLGNSGAGKSTLIDAIAGKEVPTGVGEGNTQKIDVYESEIWPMTLIDTKGFEYNLFEQIKTIRQVRKYTQEQVDDEENEENGIDVVWYCVEGTSRRVFADNIKSMNKAIKGWKKVPIFAIITKSYSELDEEENIEAVKEAFRKSKDVYLKGIIPVVAKDYRINEDVTIPAKGLTELCTRTLDCIDESKSISKVNKTEMVLKQKRFTAEAAVTGSTLAAVTVGAIPFNFADSLILVPLEMALTNGLFKIYGVPFSKELVKGIVGSSAITLIAKNVVKAIPVVGSVVNGATAGFFVFALGQSVILLAEEIYKGNMTPDKIEEAIEFIAKQLKNNAVLNKAIDFITENFEKFSKKTAKEVFTITMNTIKNLGPKSEENYSLLSENEESGN